VSVRPETVRNRAGVGVVELAAQGMYGNARQEGALCLDPEDFISRKSTCGSATKHIFSCFWAPGFRPDLVSHIAELYTFMLAREGYPQIIGSLVLGAILVWGGMVIGSPAAWVLWAIGGIGIVFTLYFFRDPTRTPPDDTDQLVLAPADGKVIQIERVHDPIFLQSDAQLISIFLSPLNVHVNRIPVSGTVEFDRYIPGEYLVAWHPKSSELNERSEIGVVHPSGARVLFKQIAGFIARRIVYHVTTGDQVSAGDRFGIVKFGSRMDILLPVDVQISARVGDRVSGGVSILGRFDSATRSEEASIDE